MFSFFMLFQALRSYYGQYFLTAAKFGVHGEEEYERRLRTSLDFDPTGGQANIEIAAIMMRSNTFGAALDKQKVGMRTWRPIGAYVQLGIIYDRLDRTEDARRELEAAVRMNPANIRAMEKLALMALERGDSRELERWCSEVQHRDINNLNPIYLRARNAERLQNWEAAYSAFQQLSAQSAYASPQQGALYRIDEIRRRLADIGPRRQADSSTSGTL